MFTGRPVFLEDPLELIAKPCLRVGSNRLYYSRPTSNRLYYSRPTSNRLYYSRPTSFSSVQLDWVFSSFFDHYVQSSAAGRRKKKITRPCSLAVGNVVLLVPQLTAGNGVLLVPLRSVQFSVTFCDCDCGFFDTRVHGVCTACCMQLHARYPHAHALQSIFLRRTRLVRRTLFSFSVFPSPGTTNTIYCNKCTQ